MAPKERALDVFQLLGRIDKKDYHIWETLNVDQKKEFSPLVTLRWMTGTNSSYQLILLNELVNTTVFTLPSDRKELLMKLLAVCSDATGKRYQWVNYKMSGSKKSKLAIKLVATALNIAEHEAEDTIKHYSDDELISLAEDQGWQKEEVKDLKNSMKKS